MSSQDPNLPESNSEVIDGESASTRLRGEALDGAEQRAAVDHTEYEKSRNPDTEIRLDGEDDTLYSDGLDIGDDTAPVLGTDGDSPKGAKGGTL